MGRVTVAFAVADAGPAERVADGLRAGGHEVSLLGFSAPAPNRPPTADGACVVVLWSKAAGAVPGLRRLAQRAAAEGRLAAARLDTTTPPPAVRLGPVANLSDWGGRPDSRRWQGFVRHIGQTISGAGSTSAAPVTVADSAPLRGQWRAWVFLLLLLGGAGGGLWLLLRAA